MIVKFKGEEFEVVDVMSDPKATTIFLSDGLMLEIEGTDLNGISFRDIMSSPCEGCEGH